MKQCLKRFTGWLAAVTMLFTMSILPEARSYNDMDEITNHLKLNVPQTLQINRPSGDGYTTSSSYFIMGSSDPEQTLTIDGSPITDRGNRGSFGIYVSLDEGSNVFQFRQGDQKQTVRIYKGVAAPAAKINVVRDMAPSYDCATLTGETITFSCIAPSGARVSAVLDGVSVPLSQTAQTAEEGVPAAFRGTTTAKQVSGTQDLGKITYMMTYDGKTTSYQSEGRVFITGPGEDLIVQVKNNASCLYTGDNMGYFEAVVRIGAVDRVSEIGQKCYHLASGGWIPKETVTPLTGNVAVKNRVSKTTFETSSKGETLKLTGTTHPMFRASMETDGELQVKLMNTIGVSRPDLENSKLFSRLKVLEENGDTTLTFVPDGEEILWGYDISYKNGVTTIFIKYEPKLSSGDKPLSGITVAVDAGHGGTDPGALGFPMTNGASEAEINLASAIAVQKRLESLGAKVVMMREEEKDLTMNDRMTMTRQANADFFVSLHSNSAGYETDGNKISGTEAYYYFDNSKDFAEFVARNGASYMGRQARGAKFSNYRVTLNTFCPSILVEMGFVTNPIEYDNMTSREGIFELANAIGDSIIDTLK